MGRLPGKWTVDGRKKDPLISLSERYRGAVSELNQRMSSRHSTYLGFAVSSAAIINLFFNPKTSGDNSVSPISAFVLLAPGAISFAFGCWIRSQDLTVGILSAFCRICESYDKRYPSFHSSEQGWQKVAMRHREWLEVAFLAINFILCFSSVFYCYNHRLFDSGLYTHVIMVNQFLFGLSSWMVLSIRSHRARMLNLELVDDNKDNLVLNEKLDITPKPLYLTFSIGLAALAFCISDYLRHVLAKYWTIPYPLRIAIILALIIGVRIFATRCELFYIESNQSRKMTTNWRKFYYLQNDDPTNPFEVFLPLAFGFFLIALLIVALGLLLLDVFRPFSDPAGHSIPLSLFVCITLLGYGVPDALLIWNRHGNPGLYPKTFPPYQIRES